MRHTMKFVVAALVIPMLAAPVQAQLQIATSRASSRDTSAKPVSTDSATAEKAKKSGLPPMVIQNLRPSDQRGLNMFEAPKNDGVPYEGFKLTWGAAFTQQFQGLQHENKAAPRMVGTVDQNKLMPIANGFNNAVANLALNAQLAKGIRVSMTSYLSTRHHQETWVKDGYALIDASPIDNPLLNKVMEFTTIRAGHFEINYGDAHFRRTDNGQAMFNPFVGNYIIDAFTTEIGAEVYLRKSGWLAMGGVTGGEIRGQVTAPGKRSAAYLGKVGFDKQLSSNLRTRLTGSFYAQDQSASNTLFTGDRAGSRYYMVVENTTATEKDNAWSGAIRPGFANSVHSYVVNPFIKYRGVELFGNIETATGKASTEAKNRTMRQYAIDGVYRFYDDKLYFGGRYNQVAGELSGIANDVNVDRYQLGAGWFVTPVLLAKIEYMNQKYEAFPSADIRSGARIKGFMFEGVIAF
jgi:hypothetical protein